MAEAVVVALSEDLSSQVGLQQIVPAEEVAERIAVPVLDPPEPVVLAVAPADSSSAWRKAAG